MSDDYNKQADDFLKSTNTTFKAEFSKHGLYFEDDKDTRDIYTITLTRGDRSYMFDFGQSISKSGKFIIWGKDGKTLSQKPIIMVDSQRNKEFAEPSAYDVLACLTTSDTGSFKDFCCDFGYDEDSRKAEVIYKKVVEEWKQVKILWNDEEIEKLSEIN